jgi:hypothetical protein
MAQHATTPPRTRKGPPALVLLVLLGLLAVAVGPPATASPADVGTLITFEEAVANPDGDPAHALSDEYADRGLRFLTDVTALVVDEGLAHSPSTVLTSCYGVEFCSNDIGIEFLSSVSAVAVWVGSRSPIPPATIVLTAYDADGEVILEDSAALGPSELPVPVSVELRVADDAASIRAVRVQWADPDARLAGLLLDDLEFTTFVPATEATATPSLLRLDSGDPTGEVTIANTGDLPLEVGQIDVSAPFVPETENCVGELPVAQSCSVSLSFEPPEEASGRLTGTLRLVGPEGETLTTTRLLGTVTPPEPPSPQPDPAPASSDDPVNPVSELPPWGPGLLLALAVLAAAAAIAAWVRPRIGARAGGPPTPHLVPRADPGVQRAETPGPVIGIHGRWDPDDGTTTCHEGTRP